MANISQVQLPSGVSYPIKAPVIPYGMVDSTSTATVFTATVPGITELTDGTIMMLKNGYVTSASGFTLNINNLGAKPVYNNLTTGYGSTAPTRDTTIFNANYTMFFIYSTSIVEGGAWICYRGYDSNSNTIGYQLRTNSGNKVAADTGYRYRLWFTSADGTKWVPANTSTSTAATGNRSLNTRKIDPFGPIVYRATNGTCNSGSGLGATGIWQQYTLNIGYSYMQSGFSLTTQKPVYLKCTPNSDGSATMESIVQALPTSKDGKIYLYLGIAYSATNMELEMVHPVYYHDGNGIKFWTGSTIPTKTSDLTNDSGYITGISSSDVTTALGYTPYNSTNPDGYTSNTGTITGITMNGSSKGTSGVVNLGTVVTDVFLDGTSVVSSGTAELTSATLTASDDGNGNVTLGLTGIGALSTASGVSF